MLDHRTAPFEFTDILSNSTCPNVSISFSQNSSITRPILLPWHFSKHNFSSLCLEWFPHLLFPCEIISSPLLVMSWQRLNNLTIRQGYWVIGWAGWCLRPLSTPIFYECLDLPIPEMRWYPGLLDLRSSMSSLLFFQHPHKWPSLILSFFYMWNYKWNYIWN